MLLASPIAALVTFVVLSTAVLALYVLADVQNSRRLPDEVAARVIPKWSARAWWLQWQSGKLRSKCVRALVGAGVRVVACAVVGYYGSWIALGPVRAVSRLNGQDVPAWGGPPLLVYVGLVIGPVLVVQAIQYTTSGHCRKIWSFPDLHLPGGVLGFATRYDFLRKVWLYIWLDRCRKIAVLYCVAATPSAFIDLSWPASDSREGPEFTAETGYELLLLAGLAATFVMGLVLKRVIAVAQPSAHAAIAVQRCLLAEEEYRSPEFIKRRAGIIDPLGERRVLLVRVTRSFDAAAARIDQAFAQHPVASILRACSRHIQLFLAGTRSLAGRYPKELVTVLNDAVIVLAGPIDPEFATSVARKVDAFCHDGAPHPVRSAPKRRWISLIARAADSLDRYSRFGTAAWGLFLLVAVIVLLLQGHLDLTKIQLQK
ncbi:hypothetical protein [Amycolatopsis sp. NPDC051716]|uniref:hypothetical protein n=1 Tax=Amycolatopsis sp. NPDC051716 TaxID=3155804 RepID=UPI0034433C3E